MIKTKNIFILFHWSYLFKEKIEFKNSTLSATKRDFPFFWRINSENLRKDRMGVIQVQKRLLWSNAIVESKGGSNFIEINGINHEDAKEIAGFCNKK